MNLEAAAAEGDTVRTNSSCCTRFLWDLRVSPFFSISEPNGQYIDVASSFGGIPAAPITIKGGVDWWLRTKWCIVLYRSIILTWCISTLALCIIYAKNDWVWMGYLSNWALVLSTLSLLCSWACTVWSHTICKQPRHDIGHDANETNVQISTSLTPSLFVKVTWILFTLASVTELLVTILFWALLRYNHFYLTVMVHGIIGFLVLMDGLVVGRIPIRFKHSIFLLIEIILYLIWDLLHDFFYMGDGPYRGANDDPLYSMLDWTENPAGSAILVILVVFVGCPLLYTLVWMLSVLGCHSCGDRRQCCFLQLDGSRRSIHAGQ